MRIAVVGAGGVGALLGGLLARAGHEVSFVARGAALEALRTRGLSVESPRGRFALPPLSASDRPGELPPAEVVLVAVKAWQVAELAPRLAPLLAQGGFVVPLQNGVEAADRLAVALGEERVVGGLCHMFSWTDAPGRVTHAGDCLRVTMGERGGARGGPSARLQRLAEALRGASVDVSLPEDVEVALWEKFLLMAPFGGVGAVTRAPAGVVRSLPATRRLLLGAMQEIDALARARRVRLPSATVERTLALVDGFDPASTASMHRDIVAGRPSELHDQSGAVVRLGSEAGVPVPTHAFLYGALLPQENAARGSPDAVGPR